MFAKGTQFSRTLFFLDDAILPARSVTFRLDSLDLVLARFQEAHIKLKPSKCVLFVREVEFLGYIVDSQRKRHTPRNTVCVRNAKFPTNKHELRSVMGLFNYSRQFVPNYAGLAAPLLECLKTNTPLVATHLQCTHIRSCQGHWSFHS